MHESNSTYAQPLFLWEQTQDAKALQQQLDISRKNADELRRELPPDKQKVNVYKVNLRKDHRIKAGAKLHAQTSTLWTLCAALT